ncbi:MAG: hypothetical protein PVF58_17525 [Candidatus Methanofastidiosia archaeon]|jgi:hypothetical protein
MIIGKKSLSAALTKKDEEKHFKKYKGNIYTPDISSISIAFKDAKHYTPEEIINTMKAAERIDKLMKKH